MSTPWTLAVDRGHWRPPLPEGPSTTFRRVSRSTQRIHQTCELGGPEKVTFGEQREPGRRDGVQRGGEARTVRNTARDSHGGAGVHAALRVPRCPTCISRGGWGSPQILSSGALGSARGRRSSMPAAPVRRRTDRGLVRRVTRRAARGSRVRPGVGSATGGAGYEWVSGPLLSSRPAITHVSSCWAEPRFGGSLVKTRCGDRHDG